MSGGVFTEGGYLKEFSPAYVCILCTGFPIEYRFYKLRLEKKKLKDVIFNQKTSLMIEDHPVVFCTRSLSVMRFNFNTVDMPIIKICHLGLIVSS